MKTYKFLKELAQVERDAGYTIDDVIMSDNTLLRIEELYGQNSASYLMEESYNNHVKEMVFGSDNPENWNY